jgi:hypothetical protein
MIFLIIQMIIRTALRVRSRWLSFVMPGVCISCVLSELTYDCLTSFGLGPYRTLRK